MTKNTYYTGININNEVIERSRSVKCLGVKLDDGLNWKEQVQSVRGKCFAGLAKLRRLWDVLPPKTKKQIYSVLVQPHLDCHGNFGPGNLVRRTKIFAGNYGPPLEKSVWVEDPHFRPAFSKKRI